MRCSIDLVAVVVVLAAGQFASAAAKAPSWAKVSEFQIRVAAEGPRIDFTDEKEPIISGAIGVRAHLVPALT